MRVIKELIAGTVVFVVLLAVLYAIRWISVEGVIVALLLVNIAIILIVSYIFAYTNKE